MFQEIRLDLIARLVHESNWQEGVYLNLGRTRELVDAVFENLPLVPGPHIAFDDLIHRHRNDVLRKKKEGDTNEELAAFNLSRAHLAIWWIGSEFLARHLASLVKALQGALDLLERHANAPSSAPVPPSLGSTRTTISPAILDAYLSPEQPPLTPDQLPEYLKNSRTLIDELTTSRDRLYGPITGGVSTAGQHISALAALPMEDLLNPMRPSYLHFLHHVAMMGIMAPSKLGSLRKTQVNVGDPDIMFPPPSALEACVEEYCHAFPTILPQTVTYDPILTAARASYDFVRIHPYADGNGRLSRLIMNLVLWKHYPPVFLKANNKGRHRYIQSLRRANRGNIEPLAALIALSLLEVYDKLESALPKSAGPAQGGTAVVR